MKSSNRSKTPLFALTAVALAIVLGLATPIHPPKASAVQPVSLTASFAYAPEANSLSPELDIVIQVNVSNALDTKHYGLQLWVAAGVENWNFSKALSACNNLANPTTQQLADCDIQITRTRDGVTAPLQLNGISYGGGGCCLNLGTALNYAGATNNVLQGDVYTIKIAAGAFTTSSVGTNYAFNSYVIGYESDGTNFGFLGQSPTFEVVAAGTREAQLREAATRAVTVTNVEPIKMLVKKQVITIDGWNLDSVTEVLIDGIKAIVLAKTNGQIKVTAPKGPIGLVDLELESPINDVLLPEKLDYGSPPYALRKEVLVIRGFALDSSELTKSMKQEIKRWLSKHSDLATLKCTGFTSLPRLTSDVVLSTTRGSMVCGFVKSENPIIETTVAKGQEDPRFGLSIRRVRLVLTP